MGMTYDDDEDDDEPRFDRHAMLAQLADDRAELERSMAEREAWLETHYVPDRPLPEPEPQPRRAATTNRRRELPAWVTLQIRNEVAAAVRRELRSEAKGGLADGLGRVLAQERAEYRRNLDALIARIAVLEAERAAPDNPATVLDLRAERIRRAGE